LATFGLHASNMKAPPLPPKNVIVAFLFTMPCGSQTRYVAVTKERVKEAEKNTWICGN